MQDALEIESREPPRPPFKPAAQLPTIKPEERLLALGKTRCGKSTLVRRYLLAQPDAIVVQTKLAPKDLEDLTQVGQFITDWRAIDDEGPGRFVWIVPHEYVLDPMKFNEFFEWAFDNWRAPIYVDEIGDVAPSAQIFPPAYHRCVTRGGGMGLGMWGSTQRPSGVPMWTMSEAEYIFTTCLDLDEDRRRVEKLFQRPIPWQIVHKYRFVWRDADHEVHGPNRLRG
jgi:energy-coupling factor transporter ATP-binding protein EcfA2